MNTLEQDKDNLQDALTTYLNSVYETGLNDIWEYIKELYALTPNERRKIFSVPHILSIINQFTPMEVINKIDQYEKVTRRSIIKTKLDEIKDMFEDPVTNEELIEILNEEKDDVINYWMFHYYN